MTEEDLRYCAAYFDARGSVCVSKPKNRAGFLTLTLTETRLNQLEPRGLRTVLKPLFDELAAHAGKVTAEQVKVAIIAAPGQPLQKNARDSATLKYYCQFAKRVLQHIRPYLRIKGGLVDAVLEQEQARKALCKRSSSTRTPGRSSSEPTLSQELGF